MSLDEPTSEVNAAEERKIKLLELSQKPIESVDCVAYHGTSLEALQHVLATGNMPGDTSLEPEPHLVDVTENGDIFFYNSTNFPFSEVPLEIESPTLQNDDAIFNAVISAKRIATGHAFCKTLSLPIGRYAYDGSVIVDNAFYEDRLQEVKTIFEKLEIPQEALEQAASKARFRKGFVIGLSKAALNEFPVVPGDGGHDFRLRTGKKGLGIKFLTAIKALGPDEKVFLRSLQK